MPQQGVPGGGRWQEWFSASKSLPQLPALVAFNCGSPAWQAERDSNEQLTQQVRCLYCEAAAAAMNSSWLSWRQSAVSALLSSRTMLAVCLETAPHTPVAGVLHLQAATIHMLLYCLCAVRAEIRPRRQLLHLHHAHAVTALHSCQAGHCSLAKLVNLQALTGAAYGPSCCLRCCRSLMCLSACSHKQLQQPSRPRR